MTDMRMRPEPSEGYPGRTYRFYSGPKVYEFGHGLSYTNYSYKFVSVSRNHLFLNSSSYENGVGKSCASKSLSVSELGTKSCKSVQFSAQVRVTNHGEMAGKHPMLLFVVSKNGESGSPRRRLVGFESVRLSAGETKHVEFGLDPCRRFSHAAEDGSMVIEEGTLDLVVGDQSHPINVVI